ncbi:ParB/Srx family N-terminal domain-containing protein [Rhizobium puerariae]|uniref:ParB/Srx family N-terminal domain-containing protein n=1 Tax=Rhizobium puerariae TaxID=1585791 RepID=A0ABV6APL6_9HYPH
MTDTQTATETFFVPLNKLDADPKNVRKTYSREGIAEMAATIRADGYRILQNIVVRKGDKRGRFFVTAGGRRLAALNLLAEAGEIAKDYPVECKERSGADATEISLIENTSREAMHPVRRIRGVPRARRRRKAGRGHCRPLRHDRNHGAQALSARSRLAFLARPLPQRGNELAAAFRLHRVGRPRQTRGGLEQPAVMEPG